jgi:hypothetical protein
LAPQLYWPVDQAPQAFGVLLDYWLKENTQSRHLWSGLYTSRIDATPKSWQPQEIVNQIKLTRERSLNAPIARGQIHFSMVALTENRKRIGDELRAQFYSAPALIPASPWLENVAPPAPQIALEQRKNIRVKITPGNTNSAAQSATTFAIWAKYGNAKSAQWQFSVLPAVVKNASIETELLSTTTVGPLSAVVVSAISRAGNESARTIVQPTK